VNHIPEIVHYFFSVINGIEQVANENGYSVICLSDDSFDKEFCGNASQREDVHHVAIKETQFKGDFHHISEVIDQGMPVVMFDRVTNEIL
jgi:LacI family transcriptional regulator